MKALAIITTFLTLVFVYLWFSEKSDAEKAREETAKAIAERQAVVATNAETEAKLERVSAKVGYQSGKFTDEKLIDPEGLGRALDASGSIKAPREFWKGAEGAQTPSAFDLSKFPAEIRSKVEQVRSLRPSDPPVLPEDDADDAAKEAYRTAKAEYDRKLDEYEKAVAALLAAERGAAYRAELLSPLLWAIDKPDDLIVVDMVPTPPSGAGVQLEQIVKLPEPVLKRTIASAEGTFAAMMQTIQALRKELADKEKVITFGDEGALGLREQLQREQAAHTADVTRLQQEVQDATAKAEAFRVEATNAQNELAKAREDAAKEKRRLEQEVAALNNYRTTTKEKMELEIRRNDPDGEILEANVTLGTAYVNLGSLDRVFPGLKFDVYGVGRGGIREVKGQVLVQKVLDGHYSQVSILDQVDANRPLVRGDTLHNPFYSATKPVHVFLAGDLKKYPKAIAAARLRRANVVIDEALNAQTDYVVVPDSLTVTVTAAPAEGDDAAPAPAAGTQSEYDRLRERARTFGATLITERQLEAFLDY